MTLPTHLVFGLIIGRLTGNYPLALAASVAVDVDHLVSFFRSGIIFKPKELIRAMGRRDGLRDEGRQAVLTRACENTSILRTEGGPGHQGRG